MYGDEKEIISRSIDQQIVELDNAIKEHRNFKVNDNSAVIIDYDSEEE